MDACNISPSVPDMEDFFGISEEFVASFESGLFVEIKEPTVLGVNMFPANPSWSHSCIGQ